MDFAATILAAFAAGRAAWPRVSLSGARFGQHATELAVSEQALAERAADLFLACACGDGDPQAIRYFESEYLSQLTVYLARFSLSPPALDDVRQSLRVKLLVGISRGPSSALAPSPGILGYRGNGTLGAWLRITAVRTAIDSLRGAEGKMTAAPQLAEFALLTDENPELATVRSLYRERVRDALEQSLSTLDARQKTLLRLSLVDDLNIDAIGAMYHVHRATVARWFVAIRVRILMSVRSGLDLPIQPTPSELRSLIGVLRDDIHLSARRILAPQP